MVGPGIDTPFLSYSSFFFSSFLVSSFSSFGGREIIREVRSDEGRSIPHMLIHLPRELKLKLFLQETPLLKHHPLSHSLLMRCVPCVTQQPCVQVHAEPAHGVTHGCVDDDASVAAAEVAQHVVGGREGVREEGEEGLHGCRRGGSIG